MEESTNDTKNSLPREIWFNGQPMYLYQGFWVLDWIFEPIIASQNHFQAQDTDIFTASFRKVGTTWLKALVFSICNRQNYSPSNSPLLTHNPHELVPQLETNLYAKSTSLDLISCYKCPRLFGTHVPFPSLPSSIKDSKCKIIYISRNPFDTFVSSWLFYQDVDGYKDGLKAHMMDQFLDMFCRGKVPYGPFPDHVLGYWKESVERPEKVLFIKYEDLKEDPKIELKKMADFLGCSFTEEEEVGGVIDKIVKLCSIEKMKEVAANNKNDRVYPMVQNDKFFRKGIVGDWVNFMSQAMEDKLGKIMEDKFRDSGLKFLYK